MLISYRPFLHRKLVLAFAAIFTAGSFDASSLSADRTRAICSGANPFIRVADSDNGFESWHWSTPTAADTITWASGPNRVDSTVVPRRILVEQTKFAFPDGVIAGKNLDRMYFHDVLFAPATSNGSFVDTAGYGRSVIKTNWRGVPYYECRWISDAYGAVGKRAGVARNYTGISEGWDPYHIMPEDLANIGVVDKWDGFMQFGLDAGTTVGGSGGRVELNVFYDSADETINVMSLVFDSDGNVTLTGDNRPGTSFYILDDIGHGPRDDAAETLSLEDIRILVEADLLPDRTLDSSLYIGVVLEDLNLPGGDPFGNGAVARFRVESLVEDDGEAYHTAFQQGVDGYHGLTDVIIGRDINDGDGVILGANVESERLSGLYYGNSDRQALLRFDGILGEIPPNATILEATLEFVTSNQGNAGSEGPYGVSQLLVPFDEFTSFNNTGGGLRFENGGSYRPATRGFVDMQPFDFAVADVTEIVQNWVNGEPNFGFAVTAGTENDWSPFWSGVGTNGSQDPTLGPRLAIVFAEPEEAPQVEIAQEPGAPETSMFIVDVNIDQMFDADGVNPAGEPISGGNNESQALFRFDRIFAREGGFVPDDANITSAKLLITTASSNQGQYVGTAGEYGVRPILNNWNSNTSFFDLQFGPFVDGTSGMIADSLASHDVTEILQAWQLGSPNFGIGLASLGSDDEWVMLPSSAEPQHVPRLVITWEHVNPVVTPSLVSVNGGVHASGTLGDLFQSDNFDYSLQRKPTDIQSRTELEVWGVSPVDNPSSLMVTLEGSVFARSEVNQSIELWNFDAGAWELVDTRPATRFNDSTVAIAATGDLSRFVDDASWSLVARICYDSTSPRQQFSSNTDHFEWFVE